MEETESFRFNFSGSGEPYPFSPARGSTGSGGNRRDNGNRKQPLSQKYGVRKMSAWDEFATCF